MFYQIFASGAKSDVDGVFSSVGVYKVQGQSKLKSINLIWPAFGRPSPKRNDDDCRCSSVHVSRLVYFLLSV